MGKSTGIEWTDHTFNPWWGCTKVSRACRRCYAATFAARWVRWGPDVPPRELSDRHWLQPLAWSAAAKREGVRRRVFCASMADVFEERDNEHGPTLDRLRARLFELIEACDGLDWQLLTKRPENMQAMAPAAWRSGWPRHVWAGATVEDQKAALRRVPHLLAVPAAVRFLSCEPLTGQLDLAAWLYVWRSQASGLRYTCRDAAGWPDADRVDPGIHWVITGGESGPGAIPTHPDWFRSLRDQCERAGVPFLFKQWGAWGIVDRPIRDHDFVAYTDGGAQDFDCGMLDSTRPHVFLSPVGKAAAGRLLDGREHNGFPVSAAA